MAFLGIALRYRVLCIPVYVGYLLALRHSKANPKFLNYGWTAANLLIVGYLVYWGVTAAELTPVRAFLYAVGGVFVVLVPLTLVLALALGGSRDTEAPEG